MNSAPDLDKDALAENVQRTAEQTALRKVRKLVDETPVYPPLQKRTLLLWIVGVAVVFAVSPLFIYLGNKSLKTDRNFYLPDKAIEKDGVRRAFVGENVQPRFQEYVEKARAKIERVAKSTFPPDGVSTDASIQLVVAIRADGSVEKVTIDPRPKGLTKDPFGQAELDAAVMRIVMAAAPLDAFPEEFRKDIDVLHIRQRYSLRFFFRKPESDPRPKSSAGPGSKSLSKEESNIPGGAARQSRLGAP
jgi:hypothetical protein